MSIELKPHPDASKPQTVYLRFIGILSLKDVAELKATLKSLLKQGIKNLMIDLEEMRDMDEAVWAALISAVRKLRRQNGCAVIENCSDSLYDHLQVRHWDRDFLFPLRRKDHLESLPKDLQAILKARLQLAGSAA